MAISSYLLDVLSEPWPRIVLVALGLAALLIVVFASALKSRKSDSSEPPSLVRAYLRFAYTCFLKPHTGDARCSQQDALESFYKAQASVYDATRSRLLYGRIDMLGLVAAQVKYKAQTGQYARKPIWVDIGGGTGHNVEQMAAHVSVPEFFHAVYIVDLSPSLLDVARKRFEKLGWKNVHVVCQDARSFRLHEHERHEGTEKALAERDQVVKDLDENTDVGSAELVTMSFSLSMIPEFHPVIDSVASLLDPKAGILAVVDFFVQSSVDYQSKNYTGGFDNRHCMWISRVFWRTWFEMDRVNLDAARRDYLEYRFGTILSVNARNHLLGVRIPYYIWIGCRKDSGASFEKLVQLDREVTESPFLSALDLQARASGKIGNASEVRSKSYECALVNLSASLPLPSSWYQNHHWRIYFDEQLQKHKQFNDSYIYAFTWEDSRVDARLLKIQSDDVVLAITSAGDNILSFAMEGARRVHAVDLNPSQNHLLELKMAAFTALGYSDVWKLFGEGKHEKFRDLLIKDLSPHLSSLALQFWLQHGETAFKQKGLYNTGGSGHALRLVGWIFKALGLSQDVKKLCEARTLNEQREVWNRRLKRVLLSRLLSWTVVGNEKWLWKALGVPPAQRALIEADHLLQADVDSLDPNAGLDKKESTEFHSSGQAIWEYVVATLEPVVNHTLLSIDNHYYLLCLQGRYSRRSHPEYLTPKAHLALSRPGALDSLRVHTDSLADVVARFAPGTRSIAVVMDSMDWFSPTASDALEQIAALNRALRRRGRVLLRSAARRPWYIDVFEDSGFEARQVAVRVCGECIDRVNMYASTWICTKVRALDGRNEETERRLAMLERLEI